MHGKEESWNILERRMMRMLKVQAVLAIALAAQITRLVQAQQNRLRGSKVCSGVDGTSVNCLHAAGLDVSAFHWPRESTGLLGCREV